MQGKARVLGHPVHQMLVMFPLALFVTAVVFDFIDVLGGPSALGEAAYWNILVGLIIGVLAAVAGVIDFSGVPGRSRAKRVGAAHGVINVAVVLVFALAWYLRTGSVEHRATTAAFALEVLAVLAAGVSAWLGGELVDRLGVGVDANANVNAPSSLRSRDATGAPAAR